MKHTLRKARFTISSRDALMPRRSVCIGSLGLCLWVLVSFSMAAHAEAEVQDLTSERWSGGVGTGFVGSAPDGIAEFAINGHADYFLAEHISIGPLAQYAGVGNDFLFGLSAQARYWWDIPGTDHLAKLVVQGGIGFIRAGIKDTDSGTANAYGSFLVPVGIGIDYTVTPRLAVTADFLLNSRRSVKRSAETHGNSTSTPP